MIRVIIFSMLIAGCSALDLASKLVPGDKPSIEANLQVGDKTQSAGSTGVTAVEENLGTITTVTEGLPPIYLLALTVIFLLGLIGSVYITHKITKEIWISRPRPKHFTSEGRK